MAAEELKPCPLCGASVKWESGSIVCRCGLRFRSYHSNYADVNSAWNRRPDTKEAKIYSLQQLKAEIAALANEIEAHFEHHQKCAKLDKYIMRMRQLSAV